jgi:5-methylcytosine-specific restriction endonuclease McrA
MPYKNKEDLYKAQKRHRIKIRKNLLEFLSSKACFDCGENDPIVLEFDHTNPNKKFKQISSMLSGHYSWKSILKEANKCEIRCANCHRRKTYLQFGHFGKTKTL